MVDAIHDLSVYRDISELKDVVGSLQKGGGGGTFDRMEARVSVLEAHVEHIKDDLSEIRKDVR